MHLHLQTIPNCATATLTKDGSGNQVPKCETSLACLYLTALGVIMGWACGMVGCVFSC